jgi:hypothetical protein
MEGGAGRAGVGGRAGGGQAWETMDGAGSGGSRANSHVTSYVRASSPPQQSALYVSDDEGAVVEVGGRGRGRAAHDVAVEVEEVLKSLHFLSL